MFFYGVLFGICWWEFRKYNKSQKNQNERLASLEYSNQRLQLSLQDIVELNTQSENSLKECIDFHNHSCSNIKSKQDLQAQIEAMKAMSEKVERNKEVLREK